MKYSTTIDTADLSDCTKVGWIIKVAPSLIRFEKVTRWQGSRDGVVFVCDNDGDTSEDNALALAEELEEYIGRGAITAKRGDNYRGFRCISAGYVVR